MSFEALAKKDRRDITAALRRGPRRSFSSLWRLFGAPERGGWKFENVDADR
jgi:hypothetical protein